MIIEPHDLLLEVIGDPTNLESLLESRPESLAELLPGALEIHGWPDARVGDYSLQIRLQTPGAACTVLQALRERGLTPLGPRLVEPRALPQLAASPARTEEVPRWRLARV
jgi:hypothetical protein